MFLLFYALSYPFLLLHLEACALIQPQCTLVPLCNMQCNRFIALFPYMMHCSKKKLPAVSFPLLGSFYDQIIDFVSVAGNGADDVIVLHQKINTVPLSFQL